MIRNPIPQALATFAFVLWPTLAWAGEWTPNPEQRFQLDYLAAKSAPITEPHRKWADPLIRKLYAKGGQPHRITYFKRSSAGLTANGESVANSVFAEDGNPNLFLILTDEGNFSIDLDQKTVLSLGVGGVTIHTPSSRSFALAIHASGDKITGIPVTHQWPFSNFWQFGDNPKFSGNTVVWY